MPKVQEIPAWDGKDGEVRIHDMFIPWTFTKNNLANFAKVLLWYKHRCEKLVVLFLEVCRLATNTSLYQLVFLPSVCISLSSSFNSFVRIAISKFWAKACFLGRVHKNPQRASFHKYFLDFKKQWDFVYVYCVTERKLIHDIF